MRHRPELDGLRGIAVLIVLASHAHLAGFAVEGGFAGVTLFFVLSGFLITSLLEAELGRQGQIDFRSFYVRRGLRLLPALFALLAVVAVGYALNAWPSPPGPGIASVPVSLVAVAGYVPNWTGMFVQMGVLSHTWSLGVEEQFYLAWPIALFAGHRLLGARRLAVVALALAILVTPWRLLLMGHEHYAHVFSGTDTHADALLLGCALALLRVRAPHFVGWLGVAGIMVIGALWANGATGLIVFMPLAAVASVAALAGCPAMLAWRPLAYVGRISYGLYLWHYLLIWWGWPAPLVIPVSIAVAIVSYEHLERPFLRLKDRYARARVDEVATPAGVPVPVGPSTSKLTART
jgi:peptidoglycan/LPS O-acetylase OafA/YrhL